MSSDALVDGLLNCLNGVGVPMCVSLRVHRSRTCYIVGASTSVQTSPCRHLGANTCMQTPPCRHLRLGSKAWTKTYKSYKS